MFIDLDSTILSPAVRSALLAGVASSGLRDLALTNSLLEVDFDSFRVIAAPLALPGTGIDGVLVGYFSLARSASPVDLHFAGITFSRLTVLPDHLARLSTCR
ncbi:MAG: hypothetical protein ACFFD4_11540 [Candidatus Odinarchaeota archaeon]